jgi:hypothetical protein
MGWFGQIVGGGVGALCSWRELNLVLESDEVVEYYDPEIHLGSILDALRRKEGLDAYVDRMKIVLGDADTGFYAAFDPMAAREGEYPAGHEL